MSSRSFPKQTLHYSSWQLIKDVYLMLQPYRLKFWGASLIRLAGDLANLLPPYALANIVTFLANYHSGDPPAPLWMSCGLFALGIVVRSLSQFLTKYWGYQVAEKLGIDSTLLTVKHLFLLDMMWHERENAGNKLKRIQNGNEGLNDLLRLWFNCCIEIAVNLVVINVIITNIDHFTVVLLLIFLISYFLISHVLTRRATKASIKVNEQQEEVNGLLFEAVSNIKTVKVMSMAGSFGVLISKHSDELFQRIKRRVFEWNFRSGLLSFWSGVARVGIVVSIIYGIVHDQYSLGFLVLFNGYFGRLEESVDELSTSIQSFVTAKISIARMQKILNQPITIDSESNRVLFPQSWQKISFNKVSFAYGDNKVLKNVSFTVNKGEKVGIVGLSGAGKSTIFKLLLKEREEFTGKILFDDISIKNISKNDYFKHVSVVLQDTEVFNFSLRDNITITNNSKKNNVRLFKQSLEIAHITDFVNKLPQGLDTLIGEKGIKLSGGERQRLGIARAIFKQPKILLLDEATSHLDLESEEKIRDSLHTFFQGVTAIVIAHRLTTIKAMDKILVIEEGELIESGSFEQLLKKKGRFFDLWEKQGL